MKNERIAASVKSCILVLVAFMFLSSGIRAQVNGVISNSGAAVSVTSGLVIEAKDAGNTSGGIISNHGTISLNGNYTSNSSTNGNGLFRIGGNWNNSGGVLSGMSTVNFNGSGNQNITRAGGETFYNLTISNTGAPAGRRIIMSNNVDVSGILTLSQGNVDPTGFRLYLSNPAVAALNYSSLTRSRILGKFERGISQAGTYLFPLGTTAYYNPANLITNGTPTAGTVLSQFVTAPPPGNSGLPIPDPPVEVFKSYVDGYWKLTSNGFSSGDFSINLTGNGFTDTIFDVTRVVKRTGGGNWIVDGSHADAADSVVYRNNLSGNLSSAGTDFALARVRPLITDHPDDLIVCENTNPTFTVTATGTGPLTYIWYKDGVRITDGSHYFNSHRSNTLTIDGAVLADAGSYHVVVRDRDRNATTSNPATLVVNKIPVATVTPGDQNHECSGLPFDNIVLGESYGVPLTTFVWSRNNPAGITSAIPMTGSALVIGDILSGSFTNTTDAPIKVTFTIIPTGQSPTFCLGLPVTATVTVNPTPRVVPIIVKPAICYDGSTMIRLTTPTIMTNGVIQFDYTVTTSDGSVVGNTAPLNNLPVDHNIIFPYQNNSNIIQSVYYHITPKNTPSGCISGLVTDAEVDIHPRPLQSDIIITKPLTCNGGSDASIHIDISIGTGPTHMLWYGPQGFVRREGYDLTDFTGLPGGQYDVIVTDNLGCQSSATKSISGAVIDSRLYVNPKPSGFGTTCPGSVDGELWVRQNTSTTGIAPFTYDVVYVAAGTLIEDTVISGTLLSAGVYDKYYNLPSGKYKLYLKDANGCRDYAPREVNIVAPPQISLTFNKHQYAGGYNVSCRGYSDGSVKVNTVSGGNGSGYTYLWYTIDGAITGPANTNRLDNIPAGKYYLITKDLYNCTKIDSVTLYEPAGMDLVGGTLSHSQDNNFNISCFGGNDGSINISISGGSGVYTYAWTGPDGYSATTEDITGLRAGTYSCVVRDMNGCTLIPVPSYTLTQPLLLDVQVSKSSSNFGTFNINCFGGTGSIGLTVSGGSTGTYTYEWSTSNGSGLIAGSEDQPALTAGTYNVVVRDLNGCTQAREIIITQPPKIGVILIPTHISCESGSFDNGSIDLEVTGGVAPYTYAWSNSAATEDISGLTQGNYTITVTDANGCIVVESVVINLPPPLSYTKTVSDYYGFNINCHGMKNGFIRINLTGGTAPYVYSWIGPSGYISAEKDIFGLEAGDYILTITDANMCSATEVIAMTQPGKLEMLITLSESTAGGFNINCPDESTGSINIQAVNQVGYVNYFWSDGSSEPMRTNLSAGDYGIIITDMNNCHADTVLTLTEPDSISIKFIVTKPSCSDMPDGEIRLAVTGGVPGAEYSYRWSDNSTGRSISNIVKGVYKVFVTDLNGCTARDSVIVEPVTEICLDIPNAISPNGDLINDVWNIGRIDLYQKIEIKVFNRWGEVVWRSETGYPQPWDGRSNGRPLPVDSYHYIIDLHNGSKPIVGNITIVK